jgi:hypothetical protein
VDSYLKAQLAVLTLFAAMIATAGCIRLISAERLEDGSAVMCVRVEPTPDAGADASSITPTMRYVPAHAPVGAAPASTGAP